MKLVKEINSIWIPALFIFSLSFIEGLFAKEEESKHEEQNTVFISQESQQSVGIKVLTLEPKSVKSIIQAPGEVIPNATMTNKITTRVSAQVIKRLVQEGEHVKVGQVLATLSSVDMAKVQGDLLLAMQEWQRVKSLGKEAISGKRYSEAQVAYQHAISTALAYGMTEKEAEELLKKQNPSQAKGEFTLLAPRDGTAFNINFSEGELIEPGRVLLQVVDEASVWIDAKLPPNLPQPVKLGDTAKIKINENVLQGKVIQVHHQLDEITRTRAVRLEVSNIKDMLHPGQYVNCLIEDGEMKPMLSLPVDGVMRTSDGDWAVYIETKPNTFAQIEVKVIEVINNQAIIEGVSPGARVVTEGAFFVHSELNKKGFDAHGH